MSSTLVTLKERKLVQCHVNTSSVFPYSPDDDDQVKRKKRANQGELAVKLGHNSGMLFLAEEIGIRDFSMKSFVVDLDIYIRKVVPVPSVIDYSFLLSIGLLLDFPPDFFLSLPSFFGL